MNHELAAKVLDKVISYPENFDMGTWVHSAQQDVLGSYEHLQVSPDGWIVEYSGPDPSLEECDTTM